MYIKKGLLLSCCILFTLTCLLVCTDQRMVRLNQTLPTLSGELLNATPTNASIVSHHMEASAGNRLVTSSFPDSLVKGYAAPLTVSTLATFMKNPYILLMVSEGIAVAYLLLGNQIMPTGAAQGYLDSFNKGIGMSAASGAVSALARTASTSLVSSAESAYVKPLVIGGALVGAATAYFSPTLSDEQKAIAYAGLVATAMPVVEQMCASVVQSMAPAEQKTITQKIKQGTQARQRAARAEQTKERVATIAVALIALGGALTTVQAYHEGTLSPETQLLAGITLSSAVNIVRDSVVYEYGYRAVQQGSQIVTHIIAEPVKEYGQRLIDGVFNAFGWGAAE